MARIYAGVLALIAFLTSLVHGLLCASDPDEVLFRAWWVLWLFAGVGYVLGGVAARTIDESVRLQLAREAAAEQQAGLPAATSPPNPPGPAT